MEKLLARAIMIASREFVDVVDRGGTPYIKHCLWVANKVKNLGIKYEIIAILHDIIEDTEYTRERLLEEGFPLDIVEAVEALTKVEGESHDDYLKKVLACKMAIPVKMADMEHNSRLQRLKNKILTQKDFDNANKYMRDFAHLREHCTEKYFIENN